MEIKDTMKVGVIGSGLMGNGIAQVAAAAGFETVFCDISTEIVTRGYDAIAARIAKDVKKGKRTREEGTALLLRITPTADYGLLADADIVFEAITEKMEVKQALYRKLDDICKPACIFATNTSGLSITEIAAATRRSDRFIGMHFFNPAPVMELLEIVRGYDTSDETHDFAMEFGRRLGKTTISVHEAPLFCVNRILVPMMNEAMFVLQEGIATREDIDTGMRLGANFPMGPLALADMAGLDTVLLVMDTLYRETRDSKYRPCPLLVKMVRAGCYGRKNGRGFYDYTDKT